MKLSGSLVVLGSAVAVVVLCSTAIARSEHPASATSTRSVRGTSWAGRATLASAHGGVYKIAYQALLGTWKVAEKASLATVQASLSAAVSIGLPSTSSQAGLARVILYGAFPKSSSPCATVYNNVTDAATGQRFCLVGYGAADVSGTSGPRSLYLTLSNAGVSCTPGFACVGNIQLSKVAVTVRNLNRGPRFLVIELDGSTGAFRSTCLLHGPNEDGAWVALGKPARHLHNCSTG